MSEPSSMRRQRFAIASVALATLLVLPMVCRSDELSISNVRPNNVQLDPSKGETLKLAFQLSQPAKVKLQIYDGRELLVREIEAPALTGRGEQTVAWDLRDQAGEVVPPEAYTYAIEARTEAGKTVRYDLADATGGVQVPARNVQVDSATGAVTYLIDRPSRVNIRMGLNNGGPLLRTLVDWVARPAGQQREAWNGKDQSNVLDIASHPRLLVSVQAFALPENSVLVGAPQPDVKLISRLPTPNRQRPKATTQAKRMYSHGQQPLEQRGDFKVRWTLPELPKSAAGLPIISSVTPVRLDVADTDRERALARRFEPVFFIDGQFAFENEVGFVPMTWNFDPAALNDGEHFLTVNLRGYEGNFGMATLKVFVQRSAPAAKATL